MLLFVGDGWVQDHHDVELMDSAGRRLSKARLPEGVAGIARLHVLIGEQLGDDVDGSEVAIGIETHLGPGVAALVAAGYTVFAVNPLQAVRFRERSSASGAKSDAADAHVLADMVRTDSHQLRPVAGDSPEVEAIKVGAGAHKTLIWNGPAIPNGCATHCVSILRPRWRRSTTSTPSMPSRYSGRCPTRPRRRG